MATPLLQRIRDRFSLTGAEWPPRDLRGMWEEIEKFEAFRRSEEGPIRMLASVQWWERYLISPVPRMISGASANLLVGEPPEWTAASEADQKRLDYLVSENELDTELHRAAMISSSEGEVWGRICYRPDLLDVPVIEFVSRRRVIPHFAGRFLLGATFVTEWAEAGIEVFRLFEHYEAGAISNELYRGTRTSLGQPVSLDSYEHTAGMIEMVLTGFDKPLIAFVPNTLDADPGRGYSDYCGLEDRFLSINRATTIGDTNTELAGKKRALLDVEYAQSGSTIAGEEIWIRDAQSDNLGEKSPLEIIDFSYDASQITTWLDHLIDSTLSFGGTSPQLVGRQLDGAAVSGTALRLKMIHSLLESAGKGRFLDRGVVRLMHFCQVIDSRPTIQLGFGRPWSKPDEDPGFERQDGLPRDDLEAATYIATLTGAEAISIEQRVAYLHPDWDKDQIDNEVAAIEGDRPEATALPAIMPPAPTEMPASLPAGSE